MRGAYSEEVNRSRSLKLRHTTEMFIKKAFLVHVNKFDYSQVSYINADTEVKIKCPEHGWFWQKPHEHLRSHGCPQCGKKQRDLKHISSKDYFIARSRRIHGDAYSYHNTRYRGLGYKVIITCKKHGDWEVLASSHLSKNKIGCPKCGYEALSNLKSWTLDNFVRRAKEVHGYKYDYSCATYKNMNSQIKIKCAVHGYFYQEAANHVSGKGCPKCNYSRGENFIRMFLDERQIKYIPQARVKYHLIMKCRYDFYLVDYDVYIEYHGQQHYFPVKIWGGNLGFIQQLKRDAIKKWYCLLNNHRLSVIPYWEKDIEGVLESIIKKPRQ